MKNEIQLVIRKIKKAHQNQKIKNIMLCFLSSIMIMYTTYLLTLPAITLNEDTKYIFYLKDSYDYSWKSELTKEYNLDLYFVDENDNNIHGQDISLEIKNDSNFEDEPYGFGYIPYQDTTSSTLIGKDIISENNLNVLETSTGEKYEFDHAEVYINGIWKTFEAETTKHWDIWCQNASSENTINDYGWRGIYMEDEKEVTYTITSDTKFKFVYNLVRYGNNSSYTVDSLSTDTGITFKLFDYYGDNTETGVNANGLYKYFTFRNSKLEVPYYMNTSTDEDGFTKNHATVLPNLGEDGYPIFNCRGISGCTNASLGYLFGSSTNPKGTETVGVNTYNPTNTLLQKDSDGYYYYDSNRNAVDYDTFNQRFMLRTYTERGNILSDIKKEESRSEFYPFTYWNDTKQIKTNSTTNQNYNYDYTEINYWFGMTMEFKFNMPKDGKVNDQDMIFSFSGDDDVWVFVDDVLVLDLGGTHGSVDGTINFNTGEVISYLNWEGTVGTTAEGTRNETNIYQTFHNANAIDNVIWNSDKTSFANYTQHTVKFYYLERGAAIANCKIKFNIPVIPSGTLSVQKNLEGINDYNENYQFRLYDVTAETSAKNIKYFIDNVEYYTNDDGIFTLKKEEKADFTLINDHTYYVEEINSGSFAEPYLCSLNGIESDCEAINKTNPFTINPESSYLAVFTNKVTASNLTITKIVKGDDTGEESFAFKVILKDSNGNNIDNIITNSSYTFDAPTGTITFQLKNNESVTIKGIPTGTKVSIEELETDGYISMFKEEDMILSDKNKCEFTLNSNKEITVYNTPGIVLPDTGGKGQLIWILTGGIFILIPFVYKYSYILKKERNEK